MSEVIVITSGKGGVGKTTTTANIGTGLAQLNKKVVMIDTDIGLRNLDVVMGLENRIVYNLHAAVCKQASSQRPVLSAQTMQRYSARINAFILLQTYYNSRRGISQALMGHMPVSTVPETQIASLMNSFFM